MRLNQKIRYPEGGFLEFHHWNDSRRKLMKKAFTCESGIYFFENLAPFPNTLSIEIKHEIDVYIYSEKVK